MRRCSLQSSLTWPASRASAGVRRAITIMSSRCGRAARRGTRSSAGWSDESPDRRWRPYRGGSPRRRRGFVRRGRRCQSRGPTRVTCSWRSPRDGWELAAFGGPDAERLDGPHRLLDDAALARTDEQVARCGRRERNPRDRLFAAGCIARQQGGEPSGEVIEAICRRTIGDELVVMPPEEVVHLTDRFLAGNRSSSGRGRRARDSITHHAGVSWVNDLPRWSWSGRAGASMDAEP